MDNLTTATEIRTLCRPISSHYLDANIETYIGESEQIDVKPILGEQMYIALSEAQIGTTLTTDQEMLLDGGVYTIDDRKYVFSGLKKSIAYFVYSRLIKNTDGQLTRYGFVNKDTQESERPPLKEKLVAADDAAKTGNTYLNEVLQYIRLKDLDDSFTCSDPAPIRRYSINAIGD